MAQQTITVAQNPQCSLELELDGTSATLRPAGVIDEDANLDAYLQALTSLKASGDSPAILVLNLGSISRINSCGVRAWMLFIERLQAFGIPYGVALMNELFVEQCNMISNMLGGEPVSLHYFEIPYFCQACNKREVHVHAPADVRRDGNSFAAPQAKCSGCQGPLEVDVIEDEYFAFLKQVVT